LVRVGASFWGIWYSVDIGFMSKRGGFFSANSIHVIPNDQMSIFIWDCKEERRKKRKEEEEERKRKEKERKKKRKKRERGGVLKWSVELGRPEDHQLLAQEEFGVV